MAPQNPVTATAAVGPSPSRARAISWQRKKELEKYFEGLKVLENLTSGKVESVTSKAITDDFMKIIKASTFLLMYNYIEGCVIEAFVGIYAEIQQRGITYEELRVEFQKIWLEFQTKPLLQDPLSNHDSYNKVAAAIVKSILDRHSIEMTRKALPVSGNLNEKKIKSVCDLHGVKLSSKVSKVEDDLEIVMTMRNDLSHGSLSFVECGREYVVSDLERIKTNALKYIDFFLNGIDAFVSAKRYATQP
jgi:hypothetical protein